MPCPRCNWAVNLQRSGLPEIIEDERGPRMATQFDVGNLADPLVLDDVIAYVGLITDHVVEGTGLMLWGESKGSGKTRLAAQIGLAAINVGKTVRFSTSQMLLDTVRAGMNEEYNTADLVFAGYRDAQLLILDDLGSEHHTAWGQSKLFELLNHRLNAHLATVVTCNYGPDTIGRVIAPTDAMMADRLRSRLPQACIPIRVEGVRDYRAILAEERRAQLRARARA